MGGEEVSEFSYLENLSDQREALRPSTVFCHLSKPRSCGSGGDVLLRRVTASSGKVAVRSASSSLLLAAPRRSRTSSPLADKEEGEERAAVGA